MKKRIIGSILLILCFLLTNAQNTRVQIARLKYNGGGDWYANKTSLPNLIRFCKQHLKVNLADEEAVVDVGSLDLFNFPLVHLTGHGNIVLNKEEVQNLRNYLLAGGFLHADDNYGLNIFFRREIKKVFPELDWIELPYNHPIYHQHFDFKNGLPKVHEHDGKPAQGFGLIYEGRLICFYSYECDLGNGWEDADVYNDPEPIRLKALQMGANIIEYVFTK